MSSTFLKHHERSRTPKSAAAPDTRDTIKFGATQNTHLTTCAGDFFLAFFFFFFFLRRSFFGRGRILHRTEHRSDDVPRVLLLRLLGLLGLLRLLRGLGLLGLRCLLLFFKVPRLSRYVAFQNVSKCPGYSSTRSFKVPRVFREPYWSYSASHLKAPWQLRAFFFFAAVSWVRASDLTIVFFTIAVSVSTVASSSNTMTSRTDALP